MQEVAPKRLDCSSLLEKVCATHHDDLNHLPAFKYGRSMEAEARKKYYELHKKSHKNLEVKECGLFVVQQHAYIGASPDALVTCACCGEGLLEIKCPLTLSHLNPQEQPPPYIDTVDGKFTVKERHPYHSQMIAQMGATGRQWCDFFVYSRQGSLTIRVPFDNCLWQRLVSSCSVFFNDHMKGHLLKQ